MSYLERLDARAAMSAGAEPSKGLKGGFDPFKGDPRALTPELPAACADGLRRLQSMPSPRLMRPDLWPLVVSDALRLARDGWAANALALGWSELDLFGAVPDPHGEPAGDGLAVWLAGRKVLALCASFAVADDGDGGRSYFNRREQVGAVLLWSLGSSRSGRS
jgi:hypothetical protein